MELWTRDLILVEVDYVFVSVFEIDLSFLQYGSEPH